jgi:hypothetical protein
MLPVPPLCIHISDTAHSPWTMYIRKCKSQWGAASRQSNDNGGGMTEPTRPNEEDEEEEEEPYWRSKSRAFHALKSTRATSPSLSPGPFLILSPRPQWALERIQTTTARGQIHGMQYIGSIRNKAMVKCYYYHIQSHSNTSSSTKGLLYVICKAFIQKGSHCTILKRGLNSFH